MLIPPSGVHVSRFLLVKQVAVPGAQVVQAPEIQAKEQAASSTQTPPVQVWTVLPRHCLVLVTHVPAQLPSTQIPTSHSTSFAHCPVPSHFCGRLPSHRLESGTHVPVQLAVGPDTEQTDSQGVS
jgi:hypothetical protein